MRPLRKMAHTLTVGTGLLVSGGALAEAPGDMPPAPVVPTVAADACQGVRPFTEYARCRTGGDVVLTALTVAAVRQAERDRQAELREEAIARWQSMTDRALPDLRQLRIVDVESEPGDAGWWHTTLTLRAPDGVRLEVGPLPDVGLITDAALAEAVEAAITERTEEAGRP